MSTRGSDDETYEDDYEEESFEPTERAAAAAHEDEDSTEELVSLDDYMKRLDDFPKADNDEENDIMSSITRGLDGLSPPNKDGDGDGFSDDDDNILRKFNIELTPRGSHEKV